MSMYIMKPWYRSRGGRATTTWNTTTLSGTFANKNESQTIFTKNYKSISTYTTTSFDTAYITTRTLSKYLITQPYISPEQLTESTNLYKSFSATQTVITSVKTRAVQDVGNKYTYVGNTSVVPELLNTDTKYGRIVFQSKGTSTSTSATIFFQPNFIQIVDTYQSTGNLLTFQQGGMSTLATVGFYELTDPYKITLMNLKSYNSFIRSTMTRYCATLTNAV